MTSSLKRSGRWLEMILLFVCLPIAAWLVDVQWFRLGLLLVGCGYSVWGMRHASRASWRLTAPILRGIGLRFIVMAVLLSLLTAWLRPQSLFYLPRHLPLVWVMISLFYPLLSALPQEYLFRRFFFTRYADMLPVSGLVLLNILFFAGLHLLYANVWAVVLAGVGGIVFVRTWLTTSSLGAATIEHALYGVWVFTIGLGSYFYR